MYSVLKKLKAAVPGSVSFKDYLRRLEKAR
jgi:hypothetical protein